MLKSEKFNDKFRSLLQLHLYSVTYSTLPILHQRNATGYVRFVLHALLVAEHVKTCYWQCVGMRLADPTPFPRPTLASAAGPGLMGLV